MLPVLSGLRIIAVEQYGAGPYGSMQLADLGAEVIKIENPADGGDMARHVGPFFFGVPGQDEELELTFNHDGSTYEMGTAYGHVALAVDDLDGTLARLREQGIEPEREPYQVREGGSRLTFVRDPDQYRIELIERSGG